MSVNNCEFCNYSTELKDHSFSEYIETKNRLKLCEICSTEKVLEIAKEVADPDIKCTYSHKYLFVLGIICYIGNEILKIVRAEMPSK